MTSNTSEVNTLSVAVENSQTAGGETTVIKTSAACRMRVSGDKYHIIYNESDPDDNTQTSTIITADRDTVKIKRTGIVSSAMTYKTNHTHTFLYHTPFGEIPMKIVTSKLSLDLSPSGGCIDIAYTLHTSGDSSENNIRIVIK